LQWFRPELEALEKIRDKDAETYMTFFNNVKRRHEAGIAKDCMATYSLSKGGNPGMTDIEIAYALSAPFSAGVDTVRQFSRSSFGVKGIKSHPQTLSTIKWCLGAHLTE
jgi:hypothetical protein